jgi:orotidine-5'-phosphate decarboxylase
MKNAWQKLSAANADGRFLCVGLDPDREHVAAVNGYSDARLVDGDEYYEWARAIVGRTGKHAAAFKPNHAFWARYPNKLRDVVRLIRDVCPKDVAVILDGKNGDIDNTEAQWADFADWLGVDAVTVSPYMGIADTTAPFIKAGLMPFVLCRTSNKGSAELQELPVYPAHPESRLYHKVASSVPAEAGIVVGATDMPSLANISTFAPATPFLIPGVGKQGGSAEAVAAVMKQHEAPWIVNVGRAIAEAGNDPRTWRDEIEAAAARYASAFA